MNVLGCYLPLSVGRLNIRQFRENELEWLFALETNEEVKRYVDRGPYSGGWDRWFESTSRWLRNGALANDYCLAVVDGSTDLPEGTCGLGRRASMGEADLRVVLANRPLACAGGRGAAITRVLIDQAFRNLRVSTVVAQVDDRNTAAVGLVKALGFNFVESEPKDAGGHNLRFELDRLEWLANIGRELSGERHDKH